jgi:large subunit ribosomal protein L15
MKLNDLRDNPGARKKPITVGRGIGSGKGKTCGRGVKGQKARTGVSIRGFEGGQMPLYRRLPKRGFNNIFSRDYAEINLSRLQEAIDSKRVDAGQPITSESLVKAGVIGKSCDGVRLIGKGALKAKVNISVAGASKGAIESVEKAGGKVTIIPRRIPTPKPKKARAAKAE